MKVVGGTVITHCWEGFLSNKKSQEKFLTAANLYNVIEAQIVTLLVLHRFCLKQQKNLRLQRKMFGNNFLLSERRTFQHKLVVTTEELCSVFSILILDVVWINFSQKIVFIHRLIPKIVTFKVLIKWQKHYFTFDDVIKQGCWFTKYHEIV